jgi:hypothetical protein
MDLLNFRAFRIAGRILGGLLLGMSILTVSFIFIKILFGEFVDQPVTADVADVSVIDIGIPNLLSIDDWLLVFLVGAVMVVVGIKLLKLRKPETGDSSLKL